MLFFASLRIRLLLLVLLIPTVVAFAEGQRMLARNLAILGLVTVLTLVAAWLLGDLFIMRRVNVLLGATRRLASGDLSARTGLSHEAGELSQLARAFDEMAGSLQARQAEAERGAQSLRRYAERLKILHQIDRAILAAESSEAIAEAALGHIRRLVPYLGAGIALFDFETNEATVLALNVSDRIRAQKGTPLPLEIFGDIEALRQGTVQVIEDVLAVPHLLPLVQALQDEEVRSYVNVPLVSQDKLIGSLGLWADSPAAFDQEELAVAREVADQLAIAIRQARLHEMERLAITDELTGLHNRRHFFAMAQREFKRAGRFGRPLCAIMLDIDHFKRVNDTYGHAVGDVVLRVVAVRCRKNIRDFDILGRYGGEEFAILLPETDLPTAQRVAERLRACVAEAPVPTSQGALPITITLGVAGVSRDVSHPASLLDRADSAMYAAKQAGRDRVAVWGR